MRKLMWVTMLVSIALTTLIPLQSASAQSAIVITEIRGLEFGGCDIVSGTTYTVAAADNPGITGCTGSASARFDVTGDANAKVKITITKFINITNGIDTLKVTTSQFPKGGNIRFDATGNLTIWIGGQIKIPQAGLGSSGLFNLLTDLDVVYF